MKLSRLFAASVLAAGSVVALTATPALAAGCDEWSDSNTYGTTCWNTPYFAAKGVCNNGTTATGATYTGGSGKWSYAYCSGRGGLNYGWPLVY
ncbi:hypothetical protein [Actinocorallia herbida]|uniref:hypothetical protein n=1 Tax=Actinocorallia herbida TaxID=58109 RepID=UPI0011CDC488|nr:hypothetical protein [Actinocorallia herbida]